MSTLPNILSSQLLSTLLVACLLVSASAESAKEKNKGKLATALSLELTRCATLGAHAQARVQAAKIRSMTSAQQAELREDYAKAQAKAHEFLTKIQNEALNRWDGIFELKFDNIGGSYGTNWMEVETLVNAIGVRPAETPGKGAFSAAGFAIVLKGVVKFIGRNRINGKIRDAMNQWPDYSTIN